MLTVMLVFCVGCFNNYFYPVKYQKEILEASEEAGVSSALVASIINVESGYKNDVVSNKGAVGLMQIMPETAEWICQKKGIDYSTIDLKDEKTSIMLGCEYLKMLSNSFDDIDATVCAYNAGPTKVKAWLSESENSVDGIVLSKIPYQETKEYLNKVKKSMRFYSHRYKT